jgi:hypothetical protein
MSFGMRIWGPTGFLEMDENSFTVRIVYSSVVQKVAGENRTRWISIPGVSPSTHSAVCFPVAAYDTSAQNIASIQYIPIVSEGGLTLYFGQPGTREGAPLGIGPQRLIVTRYR